MKRRIAYLVSLTVLSGCVVAPYGAPYYGGPAPLYAPGPVYVEPPVSIDLGFGFFHGGHGYGHGRGHGHGHGHGQHHGGHRR